MTIVIVLRNGKEISVKCDSANIKYAKETGRFTDVQFNGIKENEILYLDLDEIVAIYRKVSDEVQE